MQNRTELRVHEVSHSFSGERGRIAALHNVSFSIERGSFVSIMGPSGCGKSTLLRFIAGLSAPDHGIIERNFTELAMVFQNHAIFPWLTVRENVCFGLHMKGLPKDEQIRIANEKISEVGLDGFADSYPNELSGGMKQRVSVARAIAVSPEILLMDEPFSSLDSLTAQKLKDDVYRLWQKYGMTVIMVNHLIEDSVELSEKIIVMTKGPGTVKETIAIDLPFPRNKRSPAFYLLVDKISSLIEE